MELIKRIEDKFLSLFSGYRELKDDWEKTNASLDIETTKKNTYKNKLDIAKNERDELIRRCYDVKDMIEETRLKKETKDKIINKLRGLS